MTKLQSYVEGKWFTSKRCDAEIYSAIDGRTIAQSSSDGIDFSATLKYGRNFGGRALREMTFHQRALMLKRMALYLMERKEEFYKISPDTGATKTDAWIDIEGGISTLFVYSSKGRRELPNQKYCLDGNMEVLSKTGSFVGHHLLVPLEGVALHINAYNFPCWGMLEKLAPTILAGMPAIIKPATSTSYLTESMVRAMIASDIFPPGALQLICGSVGDIFEHLTCQDVVTFTGSAQTGQMLKQHSNVIEHSVRFNMEADSLNCSILGPDSEPNSEEFKLFIKEVAREMTVKAGQKCTAIRRAIVPAAMQGAVIDALRERLKRVVLGDPRRDDVTMGPLASKNQAVEVNRRVNTLVQEAELVYGDLSSFDVVGGDKEKGAYFGAIVLHSKTPLKSKSIHAVEAFGPVSTVMPYELLEDAIELAKMGKGSLVGSLFTASEQIAKTVILGCASYHGRMLVINAGCAKESTGHGSPMPHLVHGGPGRAGGGEEMGGIRAIHHYMQRTALQGSPTTLGHVCATWMKGGAEIKNDIHPFRKYFEQLEIGETLITHRRTITETDVVNFAGLSGDYFYAHTDEIAARDSFFEKRVAHGYLVLSIAAGLFVDPAPGPVLANYGLDDLRFIKPVSIGDTIGVRLTCKEKSAKESEQEGVVRWDVEVRNQDDEPVAVYTILTLVKTLARA